MVSSTQPFSQLVSQSKEVKVDVFRTKRAVVVDMLKPLLLPDGSMSRNQLCSYIKDMMHETPDDCFIIVAFKGDFKIVGFMICWIPAFMNHVFVHQAWTDKNEKDKSFVDIALEKLLFWAEEQGLKEIRAETTRTTRGFLRKYGFKVYSRVLSRSI